MQYFCTKITVAPTHTPQCDLVKNGIKQLVLAIFHFLLNSMFKSIKLKIKLIVFCSFSSFTSQRESWNTSRSMDSLPMTKPTNSTSECDAIQFLHPVALIDNVNRVNCIILLGSSIFRVQCFVLCLHIKGNSFPEI